LYYRDRKVFFTDETFREHFQVSSQFAEILHYHQYIGGLKKYIQEMGSFSRVIFFLAQPPVAYVSTAKELVAEGFGKNTSIIIEKPFGYDYDSARAMDKALSECFDESQIFRIDHYLAKEAVQNILVFRFANELFRPIWNNRYIESIQINALEDNTIADRGVYFDKAGILRDMVQNHLLQLLCLLTMEEPHSLSADDIRIQKINILRSLSIDEYYRYQYDEYRAEKGVNPISTTETYAELKLSIRNFRWYGTPVYIRTGKAVHRQGTEIGIRLKPVPPLLFNTNNTIRPNQILFKIQPAEGIIVEVSSKVPGRDTDIAGTHMNFCYRDAFTGSPPEAYQRLLLDALKGDHTLFVSATETETAWQLFEGKLDTGPIRFYSRGALPESAFDFNWIDFDRYVSFCGT